MKSVSPPLTQRSASQHRSQPSTSKLAKYQMPRYPEEVVLRQQGKSTIQRTSITCIDQMIDKNHVNGDFLMQKQKQMIKLKICFFFFIFLF